MSVVKTIAVVGGDMRQVYLCAMLRAQGYDVMTFGLDEDETVIHMLKLCDICILPMPATDGGGLIRTPLWQGELQAELVLSCLPEGVPVFGGAVGDDLRRLAEARDITLVDYLEREELAVLNAIPTAEGALAIAMERRHETLYGAQVLLTGMGRISKMLLKLLAAFGAHVTVSARKSHDRVWAEYYGAYRAIPFEQIGDVAGEFDLVLNTVPHLVFDRTLLAMLRDDCLIIDLASKPGGVDFEAADALGIATEWALALPGKVAPKSAARAIVTAIEGALGEMEML